MRKLLLLMIWGSCSWSMTQAQLKKPTNSVELSGAFGQKQGAVNGTWYHSWYSGKKKQWEIGTGLRYTGYFGTGKDYITAPAKLTSGKTGPGVLFTENIEANLDTVTMRKPQVNALNAFFNVAYHLHPNWSVGFNIDVIGFSFGPKTDGFFTSNGASQLVDAKPTFFNLLLISDNDLGTLSSEVYARYRFHPKWSAKLAYQFLFTEYTTDTQVQTFPELNDRFRNKSSLIAIGVVRALK